MGSRTQWDGSGRAIHSALKLIIAPVDNPLTLAAAKQHLRVDHSDEDTLISSYVDSAFKLLDGRDGTLGRALVPQTWELTLDRFPASVIRLPLPPLVSVTSVKYKDSDGNTQTADPSLYTVDDISEPAWVVRNSGSAWPTTYSGINAVQVRFLCGYPLVSTLPSTPSPIVNAMKLMVANWYANREPVVVGSIVNVVPDTVEALLAPLQVHYQP